MWNRHKQRKTSLTARGPPESKSNHSEGPTQRMMVYHIRYVSSSRSVSIVCCNTLVNMLQRGSLQEPTQIQMLGLKRMQTWAFEGQRPSTEGQLCRWRVGDIVPFFKDLHPNIPRPPWTAHWALSEPWHKILQAGGSRDKQGKVLLLQTR